MRALCLFALAAAVSGCSFVIDSDQYVRKADGGGADGSADGGTDGGADLCADVTCGPGMVCDPLTGECGAGCDPGCAGDEICIAGECLSCDGDGDGFFAPGPRCDSLRGDAPPDCNDDEPSIHPGAPMICGDGFVNDCPGPRLASVLGVAGNIEMERIPPFQIPGAVPSETRPELGLVLAEGRGYLSVMDEAGAAVAEIVFEGRSADLIPLLERGIAPKAGYVYQGVRLGRVGEWVVLATHSNDGTSDQMATMDYDPVMGVVGTDFGAYEVSPYYPPLAVTRDRTGPAAAARSVSAASGLAVVVRFGAGSGAGTSSPEVARVPDWLAAADALVIGPATGGGIFLSDVARAPVGVEVGAALTGAGDVVQLDPASPRFLAVVPTTEGLQPVLIACDGGPGPSLDVSMCAASSQPLVGPGDRRAVTLARALDSHLVFSEDTSPEGGPEIVAFITAGDGGVPPFGVRSFPVVTAADVGFAPRVIALEAEHQYTGEQDLVVVAASVMDDSGARQLWVTGVRLCQER